MCTPKVFVACSGCKPKRLARQTQTCPRVYNFVFPLGLKSKDANACFACDPLQWEIILLSRACACKCTSLRKMIVRQFISCLCRTHESIGRFVDGLNMDAINLLTLHTMLLGCTFATFLVVLVGFVLLTQWFRCTKFNICCYLSQIQVAHESSLRCFRLTYIDVDVLPGLSFCFRNSFLSWRNSFVDSGLPD